MDDFNDWSKKRTLQTTQIQIIRAEHSFAKRRKTVQKIWHKEIITKRRKKESFCDATNSPGTVEKQPESISVFFHVCETKNDFFSLCFLFTFSPRTRKWKFDWWTAMTVGYGAEVIMLCDRKSRAENCEIFSLNFNGQMFARSLNGSYFSSRIYGNSI